ncbi:TPR-like protein [Dioscorea alata]|uniref:TPR-like protein n=1 Tax=Dioscorea alata TaxID=55571 RepID=A0ACB7WUQ6_DIOAL|nr:TPR-like protein [Dioscorea alata]
MRNGAVIETKDVVVAELSHLLDQALQWRCLTFTSILHSRLLRTSLFSHPHLLTKLFLSYSSTFPRICITNLLTSTICYSLHPPPYNALISSLSRHHFPSSALQTLSFTHRLGARLDSYTLCSSLVAASSAGATCVGEQLHAFSVNSGCMSSVFVGGALIGFYSKMSHLVCARKVFDEMPLRNTVCVNTLLNGYIESQNWPEGLLLAHEMFSFGLYPDECTLSGILRISAETTGITIGIEAHAYFLRRIDNFVDDLCLQSSLVEMYGRCGLKSKARQVFDQCNKKRSDVVLWTSMINAYGRNGMFNAVIMCFNEMLDEGIEPDEIAFLAVLSACRHAGEVATGLNYLQSMRKNYGIVAKAEHYGCVIDMLCKAGEVEKAWEIANSTNGIGVSVWGALLSACKDSGNVGIGELAAKRAHALDPDNVGIFVELSNLYARVGMWIEIEELRELMKQKGLKKDSGSSRLDR